MLTVPESASLFAAIRAIDDNRLGIVFAVDERNVVVGVLTDGDVRHALVRGYGLHATVSEVMTRDFTFGTESMSRAELEGRLAGRTRVIPVVDDAGRLVDYVSGGHPREHAAS